MLEVRRIVNDIFTSNTYMLIDERYSYCWLIDIGDYAKVADVLPQSMEVRGIFLTHTHFDHIYGVNVLHKAFPRCAVFTSVYGREALYNEKKNFSFYHGSSFVYEGENVEILGDKDTVEIYPNVFLLSYYTPGHCPSCLTFVVDKWVFTGDAYIPNVTVVTKLPGGNKLLAKQSIERIHAFANGRTICPGHGEICKL